MSKYVDIYVFTSSLSVISCGLVVITGLVFPKLLLTRGRPLSQIIFFITFSEFFGSIGSSLGFPRDGTTACSAQNFLFHYFLPASWFWTAGLVYNLHYLMIFRHVGLKIRYLHAICWTIPIMTSLMPLTTNRYGVELRSEGDGPCWFAGNPVTQLRWDDYGFYGLLFLSLFIQTICLLRVWYNYRLKDDAEGSITDQDMELFKAAFGYPLVMFITWLPMLLMSACHANGVDLGIKANVVPLMISSQHGTCISMVFFYWSRDARKKWYYKIKALTGCELPSFIYSPSDAERIWERESTMNYGGSRVRADTQGTIESEGDGEWRDKSFMLFNHVEAGRLKRTESSVTISANTSTNSYVTTTSVADTLMRGNISVRDQVRRNSMKNSVVVSTYNSKSKATASDASSDSVEKVQVEATGQRGGDNFPSGSTGVEGESVIAGDGTIDAAMNPLLSQELDQGKIIASTPFRSINTDEINRESPSSPSTTPSLSTSQNSTASSRPLTPEAPSSSLNTRRSPSTTTPSPPPSASPRSSPSSPSSPPSLPSRASPSFTPITIPPSPSASTPTSQPSPTNKSPSPSSSSSSSSSNSNSTQQGFQSRASISKVSRVSFSLPPGTAADLHDNKNNTSPSDYSYQNSDSRFSTASVSQRPSEIEESDFFDVQRGSIALDAPSSSPPTASTTIPTAVSAGNSESTSASSLSTQKVTITSSDTRERPSEVGDHDFFDAETRSSVSINASDSVNKNAPITTSNVVSRADLPTSSSTTTPTSSTSTSTSTSSPPLSLSTDAPVSIATTSTSESTETEKSENATNPQDSMEETRKSRISIKSNHNRDSMASRASRASRSSTVSDYEFFDADD